MAIDLASELVAALCSPDGRATLAEAIAPAVDDIVRRRLAEQAEQLQPLGEILGCSRAAANARIARDAGLRALGIPSGRRLLYRRSDVEMYLRSRRRGR